MSCLRKTRNTKKNTFQSFEVLLLSVKEQDEIQENSIKLQLYKYTINNPKSSFRNEKIFNSSILIFSQIMLDYD
jgi:hypothetical protein